MTIMERTAEDLMGALKGAEAVHVQPGEIVVRLKEQTGRRARDALCVLTEAVSIATARINQLYYAGNAIGYASGKLPSVILLGELLAMEQDKEEH